MQEFLDLLNKLVRMTGVANLTEGNLVMIAIGMGLIFLAIKRELEPYELLPIGFGIILANLPLTRLMPADIGAVEVFKNGDFFGGIQQYGILGVFYYFGLYYWNILPPLIFICIGAMTDFGPLIANPRMLLLGAAAQFGVFIAFFGALLLGGLFPELEIGLAEACSIGIIGGADGPTTIYTSAQLARHILPVTAAIAYIYMATVAFIQPPIMYLLTTKEERKIRMKQLRHVSKAEKIIFPAASAVIIILLVPLSAPLIGMFMFGNLIRESGVVKRLTHAAQNELMNIVTIILMLCVGISMSAKVMLNWRTLAVLTLGLIAFAMGTSGGILLAKFMNLFSKNKINPLIGSAGVSAVPMAARMSQIVGQREDPHNFLLMHAMGPNVAGVIGSAIAAGMFLTLAQAMNF